MNQDKPASHSVQKSTLLIIVLSAVIVALIAALCIVVFTENRADYVPAPSASSAPTEVVKNKNSISVPGYEVLNFTAGRREQTVALKNPAQNTCLFVISLYLEDGTLLWKSGSVKPGETSENIVLSREPEAGAYKALLHYDCFTDDGEHRRLNSAETKLTLLIN